MSEPVFTPEQEARIRAIAQGERQASSGSDLAQFEAQARSAVRAAYGAAPGAARDD